MSKNEQNNRKAWPENCIWPEPLKPYEGIQWEEDWIDPMFVDEYVMDYLEIKEYYDHLREIGLLDEDYSLNYDYIPEDEEEDFDISEWEPEMGEDYWFEDSFDEDSWLYDLSDAMNLLKINDTNSFLPIEKDPVYNIQTTIGYRFINENLLRQAFTRRAFAIEYGITSVLNISSASHAGCNEELEFLGDSVLNMVVTKEIMKHHGVHDTSRPAAPYQTRFDEGVFSKMKSSFTCKEHLAKRATELGLDKYILYGSVETESDSAKEDMMEALIGAVTIDSKWDMKAIEKLIDQLINLQVDCPDPYLKKSYYDIVNAWHQRHFHCIPNYQIDPSTNGYYCVLRFYVPENNRDIHTAQILTAEGSTRSEARNRAAEKAHYFIRRHGLWANLKDSGITPNLENSIGQLQELYQKKYIHDAPVYAFSENFQNEWSCSCSFEGFSVYGTGSSKIKAKKQAAYMGLTRLFNSSEGLKS